MKKIVIAAILTVAGFTQIISQGIAVNASNVAPHSSAMLDVSSTTKGVLVPRMNSTQRTNLPNPATGLLVYDNTTNSFWYWAGSWKEIGAGGEGLSLPYAGVATDPGKIFSIQNSDSSNGATSVYGRGGLSGAGVVPATNVGVWGDNYRGIGVLGTSNNGVGIYGISFQNHGISGYAVANAYAGIYGTHANNGPGIMGESQSGGMGIYGKSTGTGGMAGKFEITNASNPLPVIMATTNGSGGGLYVGSNNAGLAGPAIEVLTQGTGDGINITSNKGKVASFSNANATNSFPAVEVTNLGTNSAASFTTNNAANTVAALKVDNNGTGRGVQSTLSNAANTNAAVIGISSGNRGVEGFGQVYGVVGQSASAGGVGVIGLNANASGDGSGVKGISYNASAIAGAVTGVNNGTGIGVFGESTSGGTGVYGKASAGLKSGVQGFNSAADGIGVSGSATGTGGIGIKGIGGVSNSSSMAAQFDNFYTGNTQPVVNIRNTGGGFNLLVQNFNAANANPLMMVRNSGSGKFLALEDESSNEKFSVSKSGNVVANGTVSVRGNYGIVRSSGSQQQRVEVLTASLPGGGVNLPSAIYYATVNVTFNMPFASPPVVYVANITSASYLPTFLIASVRNVTTTGCELIVRNVSTESFSNVTGTWKLVAMGVE